MEWREQADVLVTHALHECQGCGAALSTAAVIDHERRQVHELPTLKLQVTLFGMFKSRGFCLEETSIREAERLKKLFALLTIALCWAVTVGQWLNEVKPLSIKAHGRLAKSIFRYGFDHLRHICSNLAQPQQQQSFQMVL